MTDRQTAGKLNLDPQKVREARELAECWLQHTKPEIMEHNGKQLWGVKSRGV